LCADIEAQALGQHDKVMQATGGRDALTGGYDGASMERVAKEAQVSTATLYRLFSSKLALFEALLRAS
jgi:AcrR family transcriptional regulator